MAARSIHRSGFTLIELLVVIGVVGILLALILPAVQRSRESARRVDCQNRLKQIGLALHNYHSSFELFPPGGVHLTTETPGTVPLGDQLTDGRAPWTVLILPYLDEQPRHDRFDMATTFSTRFDLRLLTPEPNLTEQYRPLTKYQCPSDLNSSADATHCNYAACQGGGTPDDASEQTAGEVPRLFYDNGLFFHNSSHSIGDISDGSTQTILERPQVFHQRMHGGRGRLPFGHMISSRLCSIFPQRSIRSTFRRTASTLRRTWSGITAYFKELITAASSVSMGVGILGAHCSCSLTVPSGFSMKT
jgi:prepilin-type N-terminal cleavage/methylation domain-containing protein